MTNLEIGTKVTAYKSSCIGCIIDSTTYTGEIVKVNKKSIKVQLNHMLVKSGKKVVRDMDCNGTVTYRYWKSVCDGRMVDIYVSDSRIYGIIEIVR